MRHRTRRLDAAWLAVARAVVMRTMIGKPQVRVKSPPGRESFSPRRNSITSSFGQSLIFVALMTKRAESRRRVLLLPFGARARQILARLGRSHRKTHLKLFITFVTGSY